MSGGSFMVARSIWKHPAFTDEPFTEREAYLWMVGEASYKPRERRFGKYTADTERGQLLASVRFMADAWQWSKSRVARFLKRLENRDSIKTESGTGVLLVTICDYNDYQFEEGESGTVKPSAVGQKRDSSGTVAGQTRKKNKKDKKDEIEGSPLLFPPDGGLENDQNSSLPKQSKAEEKPPLKPKRKTRIPEDAVPSEANLAASDKRGISREEANAQYERFKNTHIANGKLFACWDRAWITWLDSPYFRPLTRNGSNDSSIGERSARLGEFAARNF